MFFLFSFPSDSMHEKPPFSLSLYRFLTGAALPFFYFLNTWRLWQGKEDAQRRWERFGRSAIECPRGCVIWVHAASVGETNAVLSLIDRLVSQGVFVVLSTGTLSSAEIAKHRLPKGAFHQFVPYDSSFTVARFLSHWKPILALFVESEIWPGFLLEATRRAIPCVVVNGRMSERSFKRWGRFPLLAHSIFGLLSACLAQSGRDASHFASLGAQNIQVTGNLKFDNPPLPFTEKAYALLSEQTKGRSLWVAASTHAGEEEAVGRVHLALQKRFPSLLTLLIPRHPSRREAIRALLKKQGLMTVFRSEGTPLIPQSQIYVADTFGEMGLFYALSSIVFLGGSLVPLGGHNPLEPALQKCALLTGPHTHNFVDIYAAFEAEKAVIRTASPEALSEEIGRLLEAKERRASLAASAYKIAKEGQGALEKSFEALKEFLPEPLGFLPTKSLNKTV